MFANSPIVLIPNRSRRRSNSLGELGRCLIESDFRKSASLPFGIERVGAALRAAQRAANFVSAIAAVADS